MKGPAFFRSSIRAFGASTRKRENMRGPASSTSPKENRSFSTARIWQRPPRSFGRPGTAAHWITFGKAWQRSNPGSGPVDISTVCDAAILLDCVLSKIILAVVCRPYGAELIFHGSPRVPLRSTLGYSLCSLREQGGGESIIVVFLGFGELQAHGHSGRQCWLGVRAIPGLRIETRGTRRPPARWSCKLRQRAYNCREFIFKIEIPVGFDLQSGS